MKTQSILTFALIGLGGFALYRYFKTRENTSEDRYKAQVDKVEARKDASVEKVTERQETIRYVFDKIFDGGSKNKPAKTTYTPANIKVTSTITPTNTSTSNKSPFLSGTETTANMSLTSGGTATGTNSWVTTRPAEITTTKSKPISLSKVIGLATPRKRIIAITSLFNKNKP